VQLENRRRKASKQKEKTKLNEARSVELPEVQDDILELPYAEVSDLPKIARTYSPDEEVGDKNSGEPGYTNRAPLQADE